MNPPAFQKVQVCYKSDWISIFEIPFRLWMFMGVVQFKDSLVICFAGDCIFPAKPMQIPPLKKGRDHLSNIVLIKLTTLSRINSKSFCKSTVFLILLIFHVLLL